MSSPHRSYCHHAGNIFCDGKISRAGKIFCAGKTFRTETPSELEIPESDLPESTRHGSYWPRWPSPGYSRMGGYTATQKLEGGGGGTSGDIHISHSGVSHSHRNVPNTSS